MISPLRITEARLSRPAAGAVSVPPVGPAADEVKVRVALAGSSGVGKTSLIRRYVLNEFDETYKMRLGTIVYKRVAHVDISGRAVGVTITVWDTMGGVGQPVPLQDIDFYGAQGILAVCDVTDARTVPALRRRVDTAFEAAGDIPVQILMNKSDLEPRETARTAGLRVGLDRGLPCYMTSAREGNNVAIAFEDLARRIVERSLVPLSRPSDDIDRRILVDCSETPRSAGDVARREGIPVIFAEARLERLRRLRLLSLAAMALDDTGRPRLSYAATESASTELLAA